MSQKYEYNNINKVRIRNRFKCMTCGSRFGTYKELHDHFVKYHKDKYQNVDDVDKILFDERNPGPHLCVICKKRECEWNNKTKKYYRICNSEECHKLARSRFSKNMKKIYGTDNLCADPEHQAAMLANRKISGQFKFNDGVLINYVGKYELDFLQHCVNALDFTSFDVIDAPEKTYIKYYDSIIQCERYYIPDFYIPKYDLVIEIKDSSKYPIDSKLKTKMKENAVVKNNKYNYIKIVDKEYKDFDQLISYFDKNNYVEEKNKDKIIIIPFNNNIL